jgi:hypothetical protein
MTVIRSLAISWLAVCAYAFGTPYGRKSRPRVNDLKAFNGHDEISSSLQTSIKKEFDVLDYVDPLIGTAGGGHVFPGPTMPFGMFYGFNAFQRRLTVYRHGETSR